MDIQVTTRFLSLLNIKKRPPSLAPIILLHFEGCRLGCNPLGMFQRCMMAIFSNMVERTIELFMGDFSVVGTSFDNCLANLEFVLVKCEETNLVLIGRNATLW